MSKKLLLIFVRNPELGKVKSRLAVDIGKENALKVYEILLKHTQKITEQVASDKRIYYSNFIDKQDLWSDTIYDKRLQLDNDNLGMRMQSAFEEAFLENYDQIIIIGSDMYDINTEDINSAFKKLDNNEIVIGPAKDGGYYLLGMNKPLYKVFQNKAWGTNSVLENTLTDLKNNKLEKLETRNDIDYLEDLKNIDIFNWVYK